MRPDAPVIDEVAPWMTTASFLGIKQNDLKTLLSSYLPGREPDVYPEGTARLVPAGAKLHFQIHYSRTTGETETDVTSVALIFAPQPPKQIARRIDLSNNMFRIPAGDPNHLVTECHTFHNDIYVTSLTPHMHYRGKSMRIEATYPDGRKETLLLVPEYNFNWQITYRVAEPLFLPKGTRFNIVAYFDNSANNPLNPDPNQVVRFGAASENEMMSGLGGVRGQAAYLVIGGAASRISPPAGMEDPSEVAAALAVRLWHEREQRLIRATTRRRQYIRRPPRSTCP
jgi:hypothetical protein